LNPRNVHIADSSSSSTRRSAVLSSWSSCSATIARITSRSIRKYWCAIRLRSPTTFAHGISGGASPRLSRERWAWALRETS
jgi:hypothetical protein